MRVYQEIVSFATTVKDPQVRHILELMKESRLIVPQSGLWQVEQHKTACGNRPLLESAVDTPLMGSIPFPVLWIEDAAQLPLGRGRTQGDNFFPEDTTAYLIYEISPGAVKGVAFAKTPQHWYSAVLAKGATEIICLTLASLFERHTACTEYPNQKIMVPHPLGVGKRRYREVNEVIRVVKKGRKELSHPIYSPKPIDWTHRWETRGHWRRYSGNGLGKDRAGTRCVKGATWVTEHNKGKPGGTLIRKTRIIISQQSTN